MFLHLPRCAVVKSHCLLALEKKGKDTWLLCLTMMCFHWRPSRRLPTPPSPALVLIHGGLLAAATHQPNVSSNVRRMTFCLS